ncbi:MAG: hypothetical protein ACJATI_003182 [Halioglobus sp.]|jgi:hypothetical protein
MKNSLYIIALILLSNIVYSQTRNTLFLEGIGSGASSWQQTRNLLEIDGYDFIDLHTVGINGNWKPELGVEGASDRLNSDLTESNILGIAHDYGGIVLRDLQLQNSNISAMILDGVPNQGSSALEYSSKKFFTNNTLAEEMIADVIDFRSDSDCDEDCGYITSFQNFLQGMETANETGLLEDLYPQGHAIQNLGSPTVPFVVIYGTIEENSILDLMNTQADQLGLGEDFYKSCYLENLREAEKESKDAFIKTTLMNTFTFADAFTGGLATFLDGAATGSPLTALLQGVNSILFDSRDAILSQIEALALQDAELARLAKCELSHQLLQVQWEIQLMQNSNLTYVSEEVVVQGWSDQMCEEYCQSETSGSALSLIFCGIECEAMYPDVTQTQYTLVLEENDGLLTKSEQLLEGAVQVYHLEETNHIAETSMFSGGLADHLHEIFDGGVGAEFVVPK